jgi:hypothetical protein
MRRKHRHRASFGKGIDKQGGCDERQAGNASGRIDNYVPLTFAEVLPDENVDRVVTGNGPAAQGEMPTFLKRLAR